MAAIHELYGIVSEQLEALRLEYGKLLALLARVKAGEVKLDDITIANNGWQIKQPDTADEAAP